jgi:phage terminase small subunit
VSANAPLKFPRKPTGRRWKAPAHLAPGTRKWFATVVRDYELEEHHVRLLTAAGEAWDRMQEARAVIAKDGMTYQDRFNQPKARPEIAIERDSRLGFARLLRELALDVSAPDDSRPPVLGAGRRRI